MSFDTLSAARAEQVWSALARHVQPGRTRTLAPDHASGCVLAVELRAAHDYPPFDRAVMDGYALRTNDVRGEVRELRCAGLVSAGLASGGATSAGVNPAGHSAPGHASAGHSSAGHAPFAGASLLEPGACLQINTGAPVPAGADAVVMVEKTEALSESRVRVMDVPRPGENIERQGAIRRQGDVVVAAGTRVGPGELAAIAAAGVHEATVYAAPQVALLATGDELVDRGRPLRPGQIHDSNSVVLAGLVRRAGGEPDVLARCGDDPSTLRPALELGLTRDVLVVSGGMSKGTHDLTPGLLEQLGVEWLVTSLDLKPGKPTRIGRAPGGCWVLGLPGNPVSCAACFLLFGAPLLDGLLGRAVRPPARLAGRLEGALPANGARPMFQPARWFVGDDGVPRATPLAWHGSGDPFGLSGANALLAREAGAAAAATGAAIEFVPIELPA